MRTVRAFPAAGVGIVLLLFAASPAGAASLLSIAVSPAEPQTDDAIQITVTGEVPSSCYEVSQSQSIDGNEIELNLYFQEVGEACLDVVLPFSVVFDIGTLPGGTYNVNATGYYHPWCSSSSVTCTTQTSFDVTGTNLDGDGDTVADSVDNCPNDPNPAQEDSDGDGVGDACDSCSGPPYGVPVNENGCVPPDQDYDGDGFTDVAEAGEPLCQGLINEDDFDDGVINDGCDSWLQEGVFSEAEFRIGTDATKACGDPPTEPPYHSRYWPADLYAIPPSENKIDIQDIASFLAPVRHLGTVPGDAGFDMRWDIVPGPGILDDWINISDLIALVAGPTAYPPMFGGQKAFGGPTCTP